MKSKVIQVKVYLEGIQVNFNSIMLNESVGNVPTATISFPASPAIPKLLPKTVCEIYYLEDGPKGIGDASGQFVQLFQGELCNYAMASTPDKRNVELTFKGFMQNMANAPIIPLDVDINNAVARAIYLVSYPASAEVKDHANASLPADIGILFSVLTQLLSNIKSKQVFSITSLIKPLFTRYIKNVYLSALMTITKMRDQIFYADPNPTDTSGILKGVLTADGFQETVTNTAKMLKGAEGLDVFISDVLRSIGFEMQELAAPTLVGNSIHRILIKPETVFFDQIKCNVIFNNDVMALNYQRNLDMEPTRFMRQTQAYAGASDSNFQKMLLTTVVPAGVFVGAALNNTEKTADGKYTKLNVLGLTLEERLRGVLVQQGSQDSLENAYIVAAASDAGIKNSNSTQNMLNAMGPDFSNSLKVAKSAGDMTTNNVGSSARAQILRLNLAMSYIQWLHKRLANRMASVTTPFNPYRLVGFAGVIMTSDYPTIIGMIDSINSRITADGEAVQNIQFSHCSLYDYTSDVEYDTQLDSALNEDQILATPPWYEEYTGKNIDLFYKNMTGRSNMSIRYGIDSSNTTTYSTIKPVLQALYNRVLSYTTPETYQEFVYNYTRRLLVPESTIDALYSSADVKSIVDEYNKDTTKVTIDTTKSIYIQERQDRVTEIFNSAGLLD